MPSGFPHHAQPTPATTAADSGSAVPPSAAAAAVVSVQRTHVPAMLVHATRTNKVPTKPSSLPSSGFPPLMSVQPTTAQASETINVTYGIPPLIVRNSTVRPNATAIDSHQQRTGAAHNKSSSSSPVVPIALSQAATASSPAASAGQHLPVNDVASPTLWTSSCTNGLNENHEGDDDAEGSALADF